MSNSLIEVIRNSEQKKELWQWDTGRQIKITLEEDSVVDEVHFSNAYSKDALVVKPQVNEQGNIVADIPNILLWQVFPINVYVVMEFPNGKGTIYEEQLKIKPRKKPSDYVYTETEILNYLDLEKRIKALEESCTGGGIAKETDPTVPQWAKEPTKPSYTAKEVGAPTKEEFNNLSEDVGNLSEEIADLKQNGTGGCLLTVETITIGGDSSNIPVIGITIDYNNISLNVGDTMMLAASVSPSNATNSTVLWESSNTNIATVNNGLVTAVESGSCIITAKSQENSAIKAICNVAVASESGEVKVMLSSLDMNNGVLNKDGKTVFSNPAAYHVEIPYIEGMFISTGLNRAWVGNYPPFIVSENENITIPEYTDNGTVTTHNNYTTVLSGFSENAHVYVNIYANTSGNITVQEFMNSADIYYYKYTN